MPQPINVLLVDDSPTALAILKQIVDGAPGMRTVGVAHDGEDALAAIARLDPQVVCTDLHMPRMSGLALVQEIMATCARPILVVSISVQDDDRENAFALLEAGAVEVCPKPRGGDLLEAAAFCEELVRKIRVVAGVQVVTRRRLRRAEGGRPEAARPAASNGAAMTVDHLARARILAIGASTGGPVALRAIFAALPADFPLPVVCVQHISGEFLPGMVSWLQGHTRLAVKIADPAEVCTPGTIYFPPPEAHLEIASAVRLQVSRAGAVDGHRPSVTALFRSVAQVFGNQGVGVLLTGMGVDGADGLAAIRAAGGVTIAQNQETCVVFGMPGQAVAIGAAQHVLPIDQIATTLARVRRR